MQIPEDVREGLQEQIIRVVSTTSRSNIPAIYGMAAAAEVKRLQPSTEGSEVIREVRPTPQLVACRRSDASACFPQ